MLEGLEISEIKLSEVVYQNKSLRFDSSYFIKYSLGMDSQLRSSSHFFLKNNEVVSGPFGSTLKSHAYLTEGVPFVRVQNIKGGFEIQKSEIVYISEADNAMLKNSQLFVDDLVLSKVGNTIGYYARVDEELVRCNISENNIGIKLSSYLVAKRHYILTFLNSIYGTTLTLRKISGNAQPKLNVSDVTEIPIPEKSKLFEEAISSLVLNSRELKHQTSNKYNEAEQTLLEAVGLANFKPSTQNTNIKTFAQSFGMSHRLDAEYYQPKYEELMAKITSQPHEKLADVLTIKKSVEPGSDAYAEEGLPFIRVSDFSKTGLTKPDKCLSSEYVEANQKLLNSLKPKQNTILFSKDGSVGAAYLLREDLHGVTSGAILHLNLKRDDVLLEYLTLVLNSKVVQMQAERDVGGSVILHWRVGEIENVILPIIDLTTQSKISELVQQSFTLKAQSEHLLSVAKRAVEMAIELDEAAAMHFVKNSTDKVV